jgi:hypothetical protein
MVDGSREFAEVRVNELAWIGEAAKRVQTARVCLLAEIAAAHEAGFALRAIAEAAGVSHEHVPLLLRKQQAS